MSSTDKRQIEFLVKGILQKHGIDSLIVEIDLICAFDMYLKGRYKKEEPADLRVSILKSIQAGNEKTNERDALEDRIKQSLGIDPRTTPALWDTVINFLIKAEKQNETIERFAMACEADPYGMPKTHQIANKPTLIQAVWPHVFKGGVEAAQADSDGGYR
jgi:hypothetical protein